MTVGELLRRMSSAELTEWMAEAKIRKMEADQQAAMRKGMG